MNNKIKEINWFWKNWTEDEKKNLQTMCYIYSNVYFIYVDVLTLFANQFNAVDAPPTYSSDGIRADGNTKPPGWNTETRWDDVKGEWYTVYVPPTSGNTGGYEIDVNGAAYIFRRMFNIIYAAILPFTSILAATLSSYNICFVMTSKSQRKIEESYTHIKIIGKTWLYIMLGSVFITLAVQGFNALVNNPAAQPILHP